MKVLVPTDGSEHSLKAVESAVALARREHAEVTLLAVAYTAREDLDEMPPAIHERLEGEARKALERAKELFDSEGIEVQAILEAGFVPADNIIKKAAEGGFDRIVMGSTGSSKPKGVLIGSTAAKVVAGAPCSVTIVR